MKRKLILTAKDLRETIRHITTPDAGRRVVVTAYVGSDAHLFIPDPTDLELYCWDQPSCTDPESVADVMQHGTVWFVTGLHMKIYWSERHGALIGSSNLSKNALAETAPLLESGIYYDDSVAIDIARVEKTLRKSRRPAEDWIDELRRLSNVDLVARRGQKRRPRSLADYFALNAPAPWRIAFWNGKTRSHTRADYDSLVGVDGIEDTAEAKERLGWSMPAPWGTARGEWLLSVVWPRRGKPSGPVAWMSVSHVALVDGARRAYELTGRKRPPPFGCKEAGFLPALKRFLKTNVSDDEDYGIAMTAKRLDLLRKELP